MNVIINYVRTVDSAPVGDVLTPCCKWTFSTVQAVLARLASVHLGTQTSSHTPMLDGLELFALLVWFTVTLAVRLVLLHIILLSAFGMFSPFKPESKTDMLCTHDYIILSQCLQKIKLCVCMCVTAGSCLV